MKIKKIPVIQHPEIIHSIWCVDLKQGDEGFFFPDNKAELLVSFKGQVSRQVIGSRKHLHIHPGESCLSRTRSRGMLLRTAEPVRVVIIKIHPLYFNLLVSTRKIREEVVVFSPSGDIGWEWRKSLVRGEVEMLITLFYKYLDELIADRANQMDQMIGDTIRLIQQHKGEILVRDLYTLFGVCKSTLEQKFNREIGLSPKEFCKIEKLKNFLKNYHEFSNEMTLTQLTFKSGYYDQSHLIKDFKYYVDESPKRFLRNTERIALLAG